MHVGADAAKTEPYARRTKKAAIAAIVTGTIGLPSMGMICGLGAVIMGSISLCSSWEKDREESVLCRVYVALALGIISSCLLFITIVLFCIFSDQHMEGSFI